MRGAITTAGAVLGLILLVPVLPAQDEPADYEQQLDGLYRQIHASAADLRDDPDADRGFAGMQALDPTNPLLSEECKREALRKAIEAHAALKGTTLDQSVEAIGEHVRQRQKIVTEQGISMLGFFEHLTECKGFCAPHTVELLSCHVLSVARADHDIVLFDWNSSQIAGDDDDRVIARYADDLVRDPGRRLLLIGRASAPGSNLHNMQLSADRTRAVRDRLLEYGVAGNRMSSLWLGEEPPQLEDWIAERYGFAPLKQQIGNDPFNQSVVIVGY